MGYFGVVVYGGATCGAQAPTGVREAKYGGVKEKSKASPAVVGSGELASFSC